MDGRKDSDEEETGERRGLAGRLGPRVDGRKDSVEEENGEGDEGKVRLLMCMLDLYLQRLCSQVVILVSCVPLCPSALTAVLCGSDHCPTETQGRPT